MNIKKPVKTETMFKVTHQVMEGDNYAGGLVIRQTYIYELGECDRFNNIIKVEPVLIKTWSKVNKEQIKAAIDQKRKEQEYDEKEERISKLKRELKKLENDPIGN